MQHRSKSRTRVLLALSCAIAATIVWAAPANAACGATSWGQFRGPYQVKLADVMTKGKVTGAVSYFSGSNTSTTLGVVSETLSGDWRASGTMSVSRSNGAGFSATGLKNVRIQGQWRYRDFLTACYPTEVRPYEYYGRGNTPSISYVAYGNCGGRYSSGDTYIQRSSTNGTYSSGLTVLGVTLSSQAGWEESMTLRYMFNARGYVCGNTASGESSPRVSAHTV